MSRAMQRRERAYGLGLPFCAKKSSFPRASAHVKARGRKPCEMGRRKRRKNTLAPTLHRMGPYQKEQIHGLCLAAPQSSRSSPMAPFQSRLRAMSPRPLPHAAPVPGKTDGLPEPFSPSRAPFYQAAPIRKRFSILALCARMRNKKRLLTRAARHEAERSTPRTLRASRHAHAPFQSGVPLL